MNNIPEYKIIEGLPPKLGTEDWVSLDLELFGAEKRKLHRPITGTFACLAFVHKSTAWIITKSDDVAPALQNINDTVWVGTNLKFDITHLRRWADVPPRRKLFDVMLIEHILGGGLYDDFALNDLVRRYLDIKMDKSVRDTFESATELTPEQIKYNAEDALLTLLVCEEQKKRLDKKDFRVWTDVDRPAMWAFMDFQGFRIDPIAWMVLHDENKAKADEIKASMDFNPASPQQVKAVLTKGGFKRLKDTGVQSITEAIEKYPKAPAVCVAQQVLEYRKYAKRASTYGAKFLDDWSEQESDDIKSVCANYWITQADTGRTASSSPNMQNIPARDTNAYRECFIARPGNEIIVIDQSQQEPRISAYLSQDQTLISAFQDSTKDVYCAMAELIYHRHIEKDDPFRRTVKNTILGISYGMSPEGYARRNNVTLEEAEKAINDFFHTFSGLYYYLERIKTSTADYLETVMGRKLYINPYSGQAERNRMNSRIQGTAADQMKMALGRIHSGWHDEFKIPFACVAFVHDEIVMDVPIKLVPKVIDYVSYHMVSTAEEMCPGVKFAVGYGHGSSWAVTH